MTRLTGLWLWLAGAICLSAAILRAEPAPRLVIGIAVPAQGAQAAIGGEIAEAVRLAVSDLGLATGTAGMPFLHTENDSCTAEGGRYAAEKLVAEGAAVVIGHPCAPAAIAAAEVYRKAGIVFIAPATRHPALTDAAGGPTIFRLAGRDDAQGAMAGARLAELAPEKRVAIVQDRTSYARALTAAAKAALAERAVSAPLVVPIIASQRNYKDAAAKIVAGGTEALFFAGFPAEAALVIADARGAGFKGPIIVCGSADTAEFRDRIAREPERWGRIEVLRPHAAEAARVAPPLGPRLAAIAIHNGGAAAVAAYAAVEIWSAARSEAGPEPTPAAIAEAMRRRTSSTTALGAVRFNDKGDAELPAYASVKLAQQGADRSK